MGSRTVYIPGMKITVKVIRITVKEIRATEGTISAPVLKKNRGYEFVCLFMSLNVSLSSLSVWIFTHLYRQWTLLTCYDTKDTSQELAVEKKSGSHEELHFSMTPS